jgi:hypothetical protein
MSMETYLATRGQIRIILNQSCSGEHISDALETSSTQEQVIDQLVAEVWNQAKLFLESKTLKKELKANSMNVESITESIRSEITDRVEERVKFEWECKKKT